MLLGALLDVEPAGLLLLLTLQELRVPHAAPALLQQAPLLRLSKQDGLQTALLVANLPRLCIVMQRPDSEAAVLCLLLLLLLLQLLLGRLRPMSPVSGIPECTMSSMPGA